MYAARLHEFGPAGNLQYEQIAAPVPGKGEVRIDVRASGVHGWASGTATRITTDDIIARASTVTWALGPQLLRRAGTMHELQARAIRAAADGALTPLITRYPLSRAEDAHADLENRRAIGRSSSFLSPTGARLASSDAANGEQPGQVEHLVLHLSPWNESGSES